MSGSCASNLGYGNITPGSDINSQYTNVYNTHSSQNFGNTVIPGTPPGPLPGLAGIKDNVMAAKGGFKGGAHNLKQKIKNITKKYKMKGGSRRRHSLRKRIKSKYSKLAKNTKSKTHKRHKKQRGGYAQYQNNMPLTPTYSLGGVLKPSEVGLATPPSYKVVGGNCIDNYNHFTNSGTPSKGH
jgi:hypothetical protein